MDLNHNIVLTNKSGLETNYTVLFTFTSKLNNKNYVIYTDFSKNSNNSTNVWYSSYENNNLSKLEPVEGKEEIELIDDILLSLEKELNTKFSKVNFD